MGINWSLLPIFLPIGRGGVMRFHGDTPNHPRGGVIAAEWDRLCLAKCGSGKSALPVVLHRSHARLRKRSQTGAAVYRRSALQYRPISRISAGYTIRWRNGLIAAM